MSKEMLIQKTLSTLSKLPDNRIAEISDFAEFILKKYEDRILQKGMETIMEESGTFDFLSEEEISYSIEDLKEKF